MVVRTRAPGVGALGFAVVGALALAGCNLGEDPVTIDLLDPDDLLWPLGPTGLASDDVDGDGDLDVVATGRDGYATLTNDGTGAYTLEFAPSYAPPTSHPALVDVDGDDDVDLVGTAPSLGDQRLAIPVLYRNDGTGAFGAPSTQALGLSSDTATPAHMAAGDLDGDGDDDVVVTDLGEEETPSGDVVDVTIAVPALSDGAGGFGAGEHLRMGPAGEFWARTPALGDVDGDGDLDLAVGGYAGLTTAAGDGAGGFGAEHQNDLGIAQDLDLVTTADVDGDGYDDVVGFGDALDPGTGVVAWADASGTGTFSEAHELGTGAHVGGDGTVARQVVATDLEGDGDADLLFLAGDLGVVENATDGRPRH